MILSGSFETRQKASMGLADFPIVFAAMRADAKAWRSIEMFVLFRRLAILGLFITVAIVGVWMVEAFLSIGKSSPFAHTKQGHLVGWVGLGITLSVLVYPLKKRINHNRRWPREWFRVHLMAGVMGPLLILLHSGAHLHAIVPSLALAAMAVVVVSGIVGQGVHYLALRTLNDRRRQFHDQGLSADEVELRLHRIVAQEEVFRLWQSIHSPMTLLFLVLTALHVIGAVYFGGF
jgi:hypothetical protein